MHSCNIQFLIFSCSRTCTLLCLDDSIFGLFCYFLIFVLFYRFLFLLFFVTFAVQCRVSDDKTYHVMKSCVFAFVALTKRVMFVVSPLYCARITKVTYSNKKVLFMCTNNQIYETAANVLYRLALVHATLCY